MSHLQIAHWPEYQGCAHVDYNLIEIHPEKRKYFRSSDEEQWGRILNHDLDNNIGLAPIVMVSRLALDNARRGSRDVSDGRSPPVLLFRIGEMLCLDGQSRVRAILNPRTGSMTRKFDLVHLVLDELDDRKRNEILYGSCYQIRPNCSKLYTEIQQTENFDGRRRNLQLKSTLKTSELEGLRALHNCKRLFDAYVKVREALPTMAHGFLFSRFKAYHATLCEVSMERYLVGYVYEFWQMMGNDARSRIEGLEEFPLNQIPSEAIDRLQGLIPAASSKDKSEVDAAFSVPGMFGELSDTYREALKDSILSSHHMIPSFKLFTVHMRVLERVSGCLRKMLGLSGQHGGRRQGCSRPLEILLREMYTLDRNSSNEYHIQTMSGWRTIRAPFEDRRELSCRQLWLFAMRHALGEGQVDADLFARVATRLGFCSEYMNANSGATAVSAKDKDQDPPPSRWAHLATVSVEERLGQKGGRWLKKIEDAQKYLFFDIAETIGTEADTAPQELRRCTTLTELACIYRALFGQPLSPSSYAAMPHAGDDTPLALQAAATEPGRSEDPLPGQGVDAPGELIVETNLCDDTAPDTQGLLPGGGEEDEHGSAEIVATESPLVSRELGFSGLRLLDVQPAASIFNWRPPYRLEPIDVPIQREISNQQMQMSILDVADVGGDDGDTESIQHDNGLQLELLHTTSPSTVDGQIDGPPEDLLQSNIETSEPCTEAWGDTGRAAHTSENGTPSEVDRLKVQHDSPRATQIQDGESQSTVSTASVSLNSHDTIPHEEGTPWYGEIVDSAGQPILQIDTAEQYESCKALFGAESLSSEEGQFSHNTELDTGIPTGVPTEIPTAGHERQGSEATNAPQAVVEVPSIDLGTVPPDCPQVVTGAHDQGNESSLNTQSSPSHGEPLREKEIEVTVDAGVQQRPPPPGLGQTADLPTATSAPNWQAPDMMEVDEPPEDQASFKDRSASFSTTPSSNNASHTFSSTPGSPVRSRKRSTKGKNISRKRSSSGGSSYMPKRRCMEIVVGQRRLSRVLLERARTRLRKKRAFVLDFSVSGRPFVRSDKIVHGPRLVAATEELLSSARELHTQTAAAVDGNAPGPHQAFDSRQAKAGGKNPAHQQQTYPSAVPISSNITCGATGISEPSGKRPREQGSSASSDGDSPAEERNKLDAENPALVDTPNKRLCYGLSDPQGIAVIDAAGPHQAFDSHQAKAGGKNPAHQQQSYPSAAPISSHITCGATGISEPSVKRPREQGSSASSDGDSPAEERNKLDAENPALVDTPNKRLCYGLSDPQGIAVIDAARRPLVEDITINHLSNNASSRRRRSEDGSGTPKDSDTPMKESSELIEEHLHSMETSNIRLCLGLSNPQDIASIYARRPVALNHAATIATLNRSQPGQSQAEEAAQNRSNCVPLLINSNEEAVYSTPLSLDPVLQAPDTQGDTLMVDAKTTGKSRRKEPQTVLSREHHLTDSLAFIVVLLGPEVKVVHCRAKKTIKDFLVRHIRDSGGTGNFFNRNLRIVELDPSQPGATGMKQFFEAEDILVYQMTDHNEFNTVTLVKKINLAVSLKKEEIIASASRRPLYRFRAPRRKS